MISSPTVIFPTFIGMRQFLIECTFKDALFHLMWTYVDEGIYLVRLYIYIYIERERERERERTNMCLEYSRITSNMRIMGTSMHSTQQMAGICLCFSTKQTLS